MNYHDFGRHWIGLQCQWLTHHTGSKSWKIGIEVGQNGTREGSVREDYRSWCHIPSAANSGVESVDFAAVEVRSHLSIAGIDHGQDSAEGMYPLGYRM